MSTLVLSTAEISNSSVFLSGSKTPLGERPTAIESLCWSEAKAQFREKHVRTASGTQKGDLEKNIERFLKNNNRIDETISECKNLQSVADRQYNHSTSESPKFIRKLLDVLVLVKSVGDPLLVCAPESVSVAWSAISLLISLGVNDLENCSAISEACTSIVTIVLNCRLYENRYQGDEASTGIITSLQQLLAVVLDFFWFANKKLRDKKIKRIFKYIFDQTVNETYQDVIIRYKALREDTDLAFQERVVESLQELKENKEEIIGRLFPPLKDIATKLEDLADATKEILTEVQVNNKFESYRKSLRPTNTHQRQLEATIESLPRGTDHLCKWLFKHQHYQSWEGLHPKAYLEKDANLAVNSVDRRGSLVVDADVEAALPPNVNLLYVKGRAGFGKSVMMATVIKRLQGGLPDSTDIPSYGQHTGTKKASKAANKHPVLFFFFKRGDDATQLASRAFSSLVTQLFDDNHAKTKEEKEMFIRAIDSLTDSVSASKKDGLTVGREPDTESKDKTPPTTSNKDLLKVESLAREIGKTVYIIIDGIDECTNYESEELVGELIKLGRSKHASFKIILSSREGLNFEHQFAKDNDPEAQSIFALAASHGSNPEDNDPFYCVTHDDASILTVTKEANAEDMKEYLKYSLLELMKRRTPESYPLNRMDPRRRERGDKKSKKKLDIKIADIAESIQRKSDGMFTYSAMVITNLGQPSPLSLMERLENLPTGMNELYSRQLEALTGAERRLVTLALKRIVWSPTDMGTVELAEEFKQIYLRDNGVAEDTIDDDSSESVDGSVSGEEDLEDTVIDPSVHKTLEGGGSQLRARPLLDRTNTYPGENPIEKAMRNPEISDTIFHLGNAGRDFFKFSKDKETIGLIHKSVRDWFESESEKVAQCDRGIPSVASLFSQDSESRELKLTLPIPWVVLRGRSEFMEFQSKKDAQLDILIYNLQVLTHPQFQRVYMPYYEPSQDKKLDGYQASSEGNTQQTSVPHSELAIEDQAPNDENTETTRAGEADDDGISNEGDVLGTFHKGPWRCEILHWIHHMELIGQLWPREERKGEKWMNLMDLIRKFTEPQNFRRWTIQLFQQFGRSLEDACEYATSREPIHIAAGFGLEVLVEFLIMEPEANTNLQKLSPKKETALHYLQILYFPETVKLVLQKDIDINIKDINNGTPFTICLTADELAQDSVDRDSEPVKNLVKSLRYLIDKGADLNEPLQNGTRPLQAIIKIGDESLFDLVMETGKVNINLSDTDQRTALHTIWKSPNLTPQAQVSIARKLLEAGANPNAQDCKSRAPLLEAAISGNEEGVQLLLKLEGKDKVDINDEDNEGRTVLIAIVYEAFYSARDYQEKALRLINLLIAHGADVTLRAKNGWTAFRNAVYYELWDIANVLMAVHSSAQGALGDDHSYLTQQDIYGQTVLHNAAVRTAGVKMAEFVLRDLTPEETSDLLGQKDTSKGMDALHRSLAAGNVDFAIYLLEHYANPHAINSEGESVGDTVFQSWMESRSDPYCILETSLESWTKIYLGTSPTDTNNMFLHHAISAGNEEVIRQLADAGIDPFKKDSENWDAFDWAYACDRRELMRKCFPNLEVDYQLRSKNCRDTFNPITGWDRQRSHGGFEFLEADNICRLTEDSDELKKVDEDEDCRFLVVANHPINPYVSEFYYEITIITSKEPKAPVLGLGLLGDAAPLHRMPGWPHSNIATYGFHGDDGLLFAPECEDSQSKVPETGEAPYGVGDTVGCGYDILNHTIFWTLNGRYLGVGFTGVCHRLYPALATGEWFSASANFGDDPEKPFRWNGSRDLVYPKSEIRVG